MFVNKLNPGVLDDTSNILNLDKYNGRINIIEMPDPNMQFKMQERIAIKNKATPYNEALTGTWESSTLSDLYFSAENIQILQNAIRAGVYKMSGNKYVVAPPNIDTLKIIMRSTYIQYAEQDLERIKEEIQRLNKIVLDYSIPATYNESVGYLKYREDQSTLVMPMDLPVKYDRAYKQLELKPWF